MSYSKLLHLLLSERWSIHAADEYKDNIVRLLSGGSFFELEKEREPLQRMALNSSTGELVTPFDAESYDDVPRGSIALIQINHVMTKFGNWCMWGTEDYARMLDEAAEHPNIVGALIGYHSPGGATSSVIPLKNSIIKARTKIPIVSIVDSNMHSCAYYTGSYGDKIIAIDPMAELGSIGVMAMLHNDKERMKAEGIKVIEIYPPESSFKNKPVREALEGKEQLLIEEELSPLAKHFQDIVKQNRGSKLDLSVEGLLEGKTFFAQDALGYGLIDSIGTMETALEEVLTLSRNHQMKNIINY
ncbi:MAG: S49 family peptidase [Bacteroidales bacterium]|nr:S49 family peptidase [Bacteroidales bacterium]